MSDERAQPRQVDIEAIEADLLTQASDATTTHAQGSPLSTAQRESIVQFETALATAQIYDTRARNLPIWAAKSDRSPAL